MRALRALLSRLGGLFGSAHRERELADEIDSHVQLHTEDNIRAGMPPQQARRAALLKLGGAESTRQAYRDRSTLPLVESLLQDLRFAQRQLGKNPGFAITAIVILALGISASVAIFAFVDSALLKPLPYQKPDRLVALFESIPFGPRYHISPPDYRDWKARNTVFSALDVYQNQVCTITTLKGAQQAEGARVSAGFFDTLGVAPLLGRGFRAGEDLSSAPRTVLLSYGAWQDRYGGRRDILGLSVELDGEDSTIIGVLPPEFHFAPAEPAEFWRTTLNYNSDCRECHSSYAVGRLKDGVDVPAARAQMQSIAKQIEQQYPITNRDRGAYVLPLSELIVGDVRPILLLLLSGAGLLLLISCVNVVSLLLARGENRKREVAVRCALGASPGRIIRQFVTEGSLLAAIGVTLGMALACGLTRVMVRLIPREILASMPYLQHVGLNARVLVSPPPSRSLPRRCLPSRPSSD